MDLIDRKIIGLLAVDGRMSVTDLSLALPLSMSATSERLRRLTTSGVIRRFTIELDPAAIGRPIRAVVDMRIGADVSPDAVDQALQGQPVVVAVDHLTGPFDYQLGVAAVDVAELDRLLVMLKSELGATETNTRLVLRQPDGFPRPPAVTGPPS